MKSEREHRPGKLDQLKSLRSYASEERIDTRLIKDIEAGDTQKLRELSNALFKESMAKISDVRMPRDILSVAREESMTSMKLSFLETSRVSSKPLRLPKLQLDQSTLKPISESTSILPSTMHPPQKPIQQLLPIFSINNSVSRAAFKSRVGAIKGKPKLRNEDAVIIQGSFQKVRGQYLFSIVDGHGTSGYIISQHVKENFINTLQLLMPAEPQLDEIQKALILAIEKTEDSLKATSIDRMFSGATMICVLVCGSTVVCGSLGDCKAIVGNFGDKWSAVTLNFLHTLKNKKEKKRMLQNNARIAVQMIEETNEVIGGERAYMGGDDTPGLEITRSIGDKVGKFIGMISTPEVKLYDLTPNDKFIVIGSSGFWKVLSETDALCVVRNSWEENKIETACEDLILEADRRWKRFGQDKEDVSVIVAFLNVN